MGVEKDSTKLFNINIGYCSGYILIINIWDLKK